MSVTAGIEALNIFCASTYLDVKALADYRQLDTTRFENLLMKQKSVALPYEDPVTLAVNAAKPLIDAMTPAEKDRIELLITCTESAFDFGKSLSTYIHDYLKLNRNCRLFELKNACYSGVAGFQMAVNFVLSQVSPGAKALVIATDVSRFAIEAGQEEAMEALKGDWAFSEPSGGSGATAMIVGENPEVLRVDVGANGYYAYEVMDACRPIPDGDVGDADLSLLSYLDCCEQSFAEYARRVEGVDYVKTFGYLAFHSPFGGMVKGAHRRMMRKLVRARPDEIEADFERRVMPGLRYCQRVGNTLGASATLSLASTIDNGDFSTAQRIGCFSYGSGCCSEFFSGVVTPDGQARQRSFQIKRHLDERYQLSIPEYEKILYANHTIKFGTKNAMLDHDFIPGAREAWRGRSRLVLREIKDYHRKYEWLS